MLSVPNPLPITANDQLSGDEDEGEARLNDSGAILNWDKGDGTPSGVVGLIGICWMILAVILVSGRSCIDGESVRQVLLTSSGPSQSSQAVWPRQGDCPPVQVPGRHRAAVPSETHCRQISRYPRQARLSRKGESHVHPTLTDSTSTEQRQPKVTSSLNTNGALAPTPRWVKKPWRISSLKCECAIMRAQLTSVLSKSPRSRASQIQNRKPRHGEGSVARPSRSARTL